MTYITTMFMLIKNAMDDIHMQERIDLARVECGMDQRLQHQLDVKQSALDEAKQRNYGKIREIARLN